MATTALVVSIQHSPFHISNPSPAGRLIGTTRIPKRARKTTWKVQAEARGFGSNNPNQSTKLSKTQEDDDPKKKNKKGSDEEDEIPQVVIERMAVRIVASVVMPMGLGLGLLAGFGALKDQNAWDVPFWVPVATSFLTFGASALGIAYGALSSSWDPDTKGSVLGVEQLERNWVELWKE
ncbi:hypothetical protein QQ045_014711 [Rhodiola kirilowii]